MKDAQRAPHENLSGEGLTIGVAYARFNAHITSSLLARCVEELVRLGVAHDDIKQVSVPGALELPLALQAMADTSDFDALIALGCVIRGDTYHFELVCDQSAAGVMQVSLEFGVPIANGILTTDNEAQALERLGKAAEVAAVAVEMATLIKGL